MSKRRIIALAAAVVALGLTGCSGESAPAETTPVAPVETTAPATVEESSPEPAEETVEAEETAPAAEGSSQTFEEACLAMSGPLAEASLAMAESAQAGASDAQTAVDVWTDLAAGFQAVVDEVENAEVKASAITAQADIAAVRDAMEKVFLDNDMGAMDEYTAASERMTESYSALLEFCQ